MRLLLTHGYFLNEDASERKIMKPYPPLGMLYISGYLQYHGIQHNVFDSTFSSFETLCQTIAQQQPQIVALYTNLMTKLNVLKLIKFIRTNPGTQNTCIVLGGPEVRHHKEKFLQNGADVIVIGEGEQTMLELANNFDPETGQLNNRDSIKGIAFLTPDGKLQTNAEREFIEELDHHPLPARQKINLQQYFDTWEKHHGYSVVSINTMRGCPYDCKWCSRAVYGQSYRRRSPQAVVDEIKWLQQHYQFDRIWFVDDVFTINYPWLRSFADELKKQQLQVPYEIITRADRLNEAIIKVLKESGCYRVWIGAESGSQKIIDAMSRRVKVEQVRSMIQLAQQHGIQAGTFIMLGYPGETVEDIEETIHHLKVADPDIFTLTVAYPIKGTPLYAEVSGSFIHPLPWETTTDRQLDFTRTYPRRYYNYAVRWVNNEVAVHKAYKAGSYTQWPVLKAKAMAARIGMALSKY